MSTQTLLWLGPPNLALHDFVTAQGVAIAQTEERLKLNDPSAQQADLLVSFGYRHILSADLLERLPATRVNLHISLLPWNRGADPNLWSFLEDTPKGVSIHRLSERLDAGDIICQKEVSFGHPETLRSSYTTLMKHLESLFMDTWQELRTGRVKTKPQQGGGSYHRSDDKKPYLDLLSQGWDTPVSGLIGKALKPSKVRS